MLTFRMTADPNSLDIIRNDAVIGSLQRHPVREPRIVIRYAGQILTRYELDQCLKKFEDFYNRKALFNEKTSDSSI